jgi:peptidoglycan/xylan/chitin deacetylase (PgdA/CDA1 family)
VRDDSRAETARRFLMAMLAGTVKRALLATGWYGRRLHASPPPLAVLCYHGVRAAGVPVSAHAMRELQVGVEEFAEQCAVIASLMAPVSLADVEAAITRGVALPPRAVLVTFDDGYRSVLTTALPVLQRHRVPATCFVATGAIARGELFWFDAVMRRDGRERLRTVRDLPYGEFRAAVAAAATESSADDPDAPMTTAEVATLARDPLITIGAHTVEHPRLSRLSASEQAGEISESVAMLASWLGAAPTSFAYPFGMPTADFGEDTVAAATRAGITFALTTASAFAVGATAMLVPRFTMLSGVSGAELAHRLAVTWPRAGAV